MDSLHDSGSPFGGREHGNSIPALPYATEAGPVEAKPLQANPSTGCGASRNLTRRPCGCIVNEVLFTENFHWFMARSVVAVVTASFLRSPQRFTTHFHNMADERPVILWMPGCFWISVVNTFLSRTYPSGTGQVSRFCDDAFLSMANVPDQATNRLPWQEHVPFAHYRK